MLYLFFWSFKLPLYLVVKLHPNIARPQSYFFILHFLLIILLLLEFFMEALHDGSSRIWFLLEVFIDILFRGAQVFFILQSGVLFFLPYHRRWYYVILDNLSSCFMIHMLLRMRYFKSINLFVGVILCHISPKAFPKDCCYLWCL